MAESTYSRKLDASGRIMIPVKLRDAMNMEVGKEYSFIVLEHNHRKYICIDCGPAGELRDALQVAEKYGYKFTN